MAYPKIILSYSYSYTKNNFRQKPKFEVLISIQKETVQFDQCFLTGEPQNFSKCVAES